MDVEKLALDRRSKRSNELHVHPSQLITHKKSSGIKFTLRQFFKPLLILSLLLTLTTLLPNPITPFWHLSNHFHPSQLQTTTTATNDPADSWQDNIFPYRQPAPWDISTDFPHPRKLEYDVTEGTWLRLDVHPTSGEIVFDMAGDLYCLPASAYRGVLDGGAAAHTRARPILLGVPHDSDPHFSPDGQRIVFRSDAELGVENIWVMGWKGCEGMDVRPRGWVDGVGLNGELVEALEGRDVEEEMLVAGVKEDERRKTRRLIREGRNGARRVTNETYRYISDARFHPSGKSVVATKWYTSARSIGAGEGWQYDLPSASHSQNHTQQEKIGVESGKRIVGRTLPPGFGVEEYGDQQIGPEQFIWRAEDVVIYAKNVVDDMVFEYSKDVHKGIYAIYSRNLTTGRTEELVGASPGGASRPELSRDGRTLAFVRRVRDKEALVLKDLHTGTLHNVWHGLSYDLSTIFAPMGTYPSFAFTPDDTAVIIWAAGQIYYVPLAVNIYGEKTASSAHAPFAIPFRAHIEKRLAETRVLQPGEGAYDLVGEEKAGKARIGVFKDLRVDESGERVLFTAAGISFVQNVSNPKLGSDSEGSVGTNARPSQVEPQRVPVLHPGSPYYSPVVISGAPNLVLHARWSDVNFTALELADLDSGQVWELRGIPRGRYRSPVLCECKGNRRRIAVIRNGGDWLTGNVVETAGAGLWVGELTLPSPNSTTASSRGEIEVSKWQFVPSEISPSNCVQMKFVNGGKELLVQQPQRAFVIDLQSGSSKSEETPDHRTLAEGRMSEELVVDPSVVDAKKGSVNVAFVENYHVYLAPDVREKKGKGGGLDPVWGRPGNATRGLVRLSLDGGHDVTWSRDGSRLFWFLGPYLHSLEVSRLGRCAKAIEKDGNTFGIGCVKRLLDVWEVVVERETDVARLKRDAWVMANTGQAKVGTEDVANVDMLVIANATILTMEGGDDVVRSGVLVSKGGIIEFVGSVADVASVAAPGVNVIDAQGGFVIPGFIDMHAHWNGFFTTYPATSWELETFLAYGVTTLHNPSAETITGFDEYHRVEDGQLVGPRIFTVGTIIYGAGNPGYYQDIADDAEAYSALLRIKVEGGPASISYKNYQLPSRASRQRLLLASRNLSMICVPEGGMNWDWDLTYIVDGMTTVEHAIPVPVLYDDILTLYALSGTGSTPTHVVNYGGTMGEQFIWAKEDIPNDPKLRRFTRHDILEGLTESTSRPLTSYALFNTSASVAKMVHKGQRTHIGAHGEAPLGVNYHAEMFFAQQGGLSNYEVLQAATSSAAETLGLQSSIGSLSRGKLADFIVYPPGIDLLHGSFLEMRDIRYVSRGGRLWEASTMEQVWPKKGWKQRLPPINAE